MVWQLSTVVNYAMWKVTSNPMLQVSHAMKVGRGASAQWCLKRQLDQRYLVRKRVNRLFTAANLIYIMFYRGGCCPVQCCRPHTSYQSSQSL